MNVQHAPAQTSELRHRIDGLMPVDPSDKQRCFAQPRKLAHPHRRGRHLTVQVALARVAQTSATQIFQRENAVVPVNPLHADGVAPDFVQPFDLRSL